MDLKSWQWSEWERPLFFDGVVVCISFPICAIHVFRMPMGYNQERREKKINNSYTGSSKIFMVLKRKKEENEIKNFNVFLLPFSVCIYSWDE